MKYKRCKDKQFHGECRIVKALGFYDLVPCPWCGYLVSYHNIGKWCSGCYTLFMYDKTTHEIHFGKSIEKTISVAFAIAVEKSGGARFGKLSTNKEDTIDTGRKLNNC